MMNWPWMERILNHGIFSTLKNNKRALNILVICFWSLFIVIILWGGWQNRQVVIPYLVHANYIYLPGSICYLASLAPSQLGVSS
jgi:hypothetical protein